MTTRRVTLIQYYQKDELEKEFNKIFSGNSIVSYHTSGLVYEMSSEINLSNGEVYLFTSGDQWGCQVNTLMKFALNETIDRVVITPLEEEAYRENPHRNADQYHRVEFYGTENTLVGVMVTSSWDGMFEEGNLYIYHDESGSGLYMPEPDSESVNEFMKLIENTNVTVVGLEGFRGSEERENRPHIRYLVEAPNGSTYTGFLQRVENGFIGRPEIWGMLDKEKFSFFSTSLEGEGSIEEDRLILENFERVIYNR